MAVNGILSSVNLIAGAGILGNVNGPTFGANTGLTSNISSYTSVAVVSQFANVATSGFVTANVVSNTFPALTNGIPTSYQSSLGNGTMTGAIQYQSNRILGGGDNGKFSQILSSASGYMVTINQLIKSMLNANSPENKTNFVSQDNVISGSLSGWTLAFSATGQDLVQLGNLIDFANLGQLGSPYALLKQIFAQTASTPSLNNALILAGISEETLTTFGSTTLSDAEQKLIYQAMTNIKGSDLTQILRLLKVTTSGLETMADLLNPIKIFPRSFTTFTTTTKNGLRAIYLDNIGTINSLLLTELPQEVLRPLQGIPQASTTTYEQLKKIIPPDQALANKALQVALEQVKTIFNTTAVKLGRSMINLETDIGLGLINALTQPLPANVAAFYQNNLTLGTGPDGLLLLTDIIGTPSGWVHNDNLTNTVVELNYMTSVNAFANLTNGSNGVYTTMANTANGDYTTSSGFPLVTWSTVIPAGQPGSGTYTGNTASESIQLAFNNGLIPNMIANVNSIVISYSGNVTQLNNNWSNIATQINRENYILANAQVDFANLAPNVTPTSMVSSLSYYGLDTAEGGAAYILQSVADISTLSGQAVISTMREARNQVLLSNAGIETNIVISDQYPETQANLGTTQYTVSQASSQKII